MYLLDTNVISEMRKLKTPRADVNVERWVESVPPGSLFLSVLTLLELEVGVNQLLRRDNARGTILSAWLQQQVLPSFADRILPVDTVVAQRCAALQVPVSRPRFDALIAATAIVHRMTVVTRNLADFLPMGVDILNPWNFQPAP